MRKFVLYESFDQIDDDILERSEEGCGKPLSFPARHWRAIAACACFAAAVLLPVIRLLQAGGGNPMGNGLPDPIIIASSEAWPDNSSGEGMGALEAPDGQASHAGGLEASADGSGLGDSGVPDASKEKGLHADESEPSAPGSGSGNSGVPDTSNGQTSATGEATADEASFDGTDNQVMIKETVVQDQSKSLTLSEALASEPFGSYMLSEAPAGFVPESFRQHHDEFTNCLSGLWTKSGSYDELRWKVSYYQESDAKRVTSADDTQNYDMGLYSIPLCDSVPEELREIVDHPIFRLDELTQEVVSRRAYSVADRGDSSGVRMSFGVLCGDVVVEVSSKGVSPEWLYERLADLARD